MLAVADVRPGEEYVTVYVVLVVPVIPKSVNEATPVPASTVAV